MGSTLTGPTFKVIIIIVICFPTEHLKSAQELIQHVSVHLRIELEFGSVGFSGEEKTGVTRENLSEQGENQQQKQRWLEASALTIVPTLLPCTCIKA